MPYCIQIGNAVLRMSGKRPVSCRWCNKIHTKLCDYPVGEKTCDAPMCDDHADHVEGQDLDYCPMHKDKPGVVKSLL